jgi:hypothetical protein
VLQPAFVKGMIDALQHHAPEIFHGACLHPCADYFFILIILHHKTSFT